MPALTAQRPLAPLTTWRVGGAAARFAEPSTADEVLSLIRRAEEEALPWSIVGKGSNLLVADAGYPGLIIRLVENHSTIRVEEDRIVAQAGATNSALVKAGMEMALGGIEYLSSIPGSVGGAVFMNAGAHGVETSEVLIAALILERSGEAHWRTPEELQMRYRHSCLQETGGIVLEAAFRVKPRAASEIRAEVLEFAAWRRKRQPQDPSAGSVFRNPDGDSAGRLIEATGLKGFAIGGAMVSPIHANFIVNTGKASAQDVNAVISAVRRRVFEAHGHLLRPEVRGLGLVVGEGAPA